MKSIKLNRESKIALIFIFALVVFVWGINFLKGSDLLQKTRRFYADYDNVSGLMTANPVLLNGFRIGLVTDMYFTDDKSGKVRVELTINKDVIIPKNSRARIINSDLLGSKAVQIILGDYGEAKNGDLLIPEVQANLIDEVATQFTPIKIKAESILTSIDSIVSSMSMIFNNDTKENLISSFENIKQTIIHLNGSLSSVDQVLSKDKNKLSNIIANIESISLNLKNNNAKISNALNNFSNISDTIAKANLATTIQNISTSVEQVQKMLDKINRGEGSLGQLANNDTLYNNLQGASENLNLLLKDMKENPKRYVGFSIFGNKDKKKK